MGVWIETINTDMGIVKNWSHPVWVCGLKPERDGLSTLTGLSHPVWVCGLKHAYLQVYNLMSRHTLYGCVD